ncbi:Tubulin-folding cofactor C [Chlorella vulgaris]
MAQHHGVIEALDAPAEASKGASVLARLAEREEQRAATAVKRLEELQVSSDPRESVDAFMEHFSTRRQQLEAALQACATPGNAAPHDQLTALGEQLAALEKAVADATYFLPAYDQRQATLALAALREQQEATAAALQPRKRFAFNRKATKAANAPAAVVGARAGGAAEQPGSTITASQQHPQHPQQTDLSGGVSGSAIRGLKGRVLALSRQDAAGKEVTLSDLEDCVVYLLAPLAALFLAGLRRCKVYTGPVAGACFIEGASDCVLMIAARQVRIHSAVGTDVYLRVRSHPIIEHSDKLRFAPYTPAYPGAQQDLEEQGLHTDAEALWRQVDDFGWLRATPSPHWSELPADQHLAAPHTPAASEAD